MPLILPLDFVIKTYSNSNSGFNISHFKNTQHDKSAPAHFHITISLKNEMSLVVCMITSQMQRLERIYRSTEPDAIDCLIPLDSTVFPFITKSCVINCNEAKLLTSKEFAQIIDRTHGIEAKAGDNDIDLELKENIIKAIYRSPLVHENSKNALKASYPEFFK
jgi:hypothetical protein